MWESDTRALPFLTSAPGGYYSNIEDKKVKPQPQIPICVEILADQVCCTFGALVIIGRCNKKDSNIFGVIP
jgi:hypothetical protein